MYNMTETIVAIVGIWGVIANKMEASHIRHSLTGIILHHDGCYFIFVLVRL